MIDLSASVTYRGQELNGADIASPAGPISGCKIESFTWPPVAGVGYTEKRTQGDGLDSSDVFAGGRRFSLRGTLYGSTRGATFDLFRTLSAIFAPTLAYDDDADAFGYRPLAFSSPTADLDNFGSGTISLFANVRPLGTPDFGAISRDTSGGTKPFAMPWTVTLEARDPRIYVATPVEVSLAGADGGSGTLAQRGSYPTPLTIILVSDTSSPQNFRFLGMDSDITIAIPDLAGGGHTLRFDGDTRQLTRVYLGNTELENGYLSSAAEVTYPLVPAGGGGYVWTISAHTNLLSGSKLLYYEAFI